MTTLFLLAVAFCLYTYLAFPLLLHFRALRRSTRFDPASNEVAVQGSKTRHCSSPLTVSVVIAVHNEEVTLPLKIASLDSLTYPAQHLEIMFVSDGSTDSTDQLLEQACRQRDHWRLIQYSPARGKPTALNRGVEQAKGDILVFMDARQRISENAIDVLVDRLVDPVIGAVSGELVLADCHGGEAAQVSLYWRYEKWIRHNESLLGSTTGATGALYAIRRQDYKPLKADTLLDDFDTPVQLLARGLRTVLEPSAKVFDVAESDSRGEFRRKSRTLAGNFQSFSRHVWLFHPIKNPVWWQFLSHKVFRLLVPYALLLAFIAAGLGDTFFLQLMFLAQCCFYALGVLGWLGIDSRFMSAIGIFLMLNAAAVVGAWQALNGRASVHWKRS